MIKEGNKKMSKEIKKITREEREHIENRMLTVFAVALGAVMLLMYLANWFNGSKGFKTAAEVIVYIAVVSFIGLAVFCKLKSKKFFKEAQELRAKKYNNWFIFSIVAAVFSFLVYPDNILKLILREDTFNVFYVNFWGRWTWFGQSVIASRLIFFMILIGLYTLGVFIYYGIYLNNAHKASLNKGAKKKAK